MVLSEVLHGHQQQFGGLPAPLQGQHAPPLLQGQQSQRRYYHTAPLALGTVKFQWVPYGTGELVVLPSPEGGIASNGYRTPPLAWGLEKMDKDLEVWSWTKVYQIVELSKE